MEVWHHSKKTHILRGISDQSENVKRDFANSILHNYYELGISDAEFKSLDLKLLRQVAHLRKRKVFKPLWKRSGIPRISLLKPTMEPVKIFDKVNQCVRTNKISFRVMLWNVLVSASFIGPAFLQQLFTNTTTAIALLSNPLDNNVIKNISFWRCAEFYSLQLDRSMIGITYEITNGFLW